MFGNYVTESIFYLPALVAFALKIWMLTTARKRPWADNAWLGFLIIFSMHNLCEIIILKGPESAFSAEYLLRTYYVCSLASMVYGLNYVCDKTNVVQGIIFRAVAIFAALMVVLILGTDFIVYGVRDFGYTISSYKGDAFGSFQFTSLVVLGLILMFLWYNYLFKEDYKTRTEVKYSLYALTPLVLLTAAIVISKSYGYGINPAMFVPIGSTAFLMISLIGKAKVYDIPAKSLILVPNLKKVAMKQAAEASAIFNGSGKKHSQMLTLVEHSLVYIQQVSNHDLAQRSDLQHTNPAQHYRSVLDSIAKDQQPPANDDS